ncbi:hypothetical protein HU200_062656 [Digitaria exilis]|uniref:DUF1618 domain-containing protein n=1 Tax=Digitaria exilis TaxID=1010633 RepID=A0A835DVX8_9POAL|nr:hypothetical protein HU200_062656 [Digitaria exilis]
MVSPSSSAELAEPRASWIILGRVASTSPATLGATTVCVADRTAELSAFSGVTNVGLLPLSDSSSAGFVVAELQVAQRHGRRVGDLIWFRSDEASWDEAELACPDVTPWASPDWIPHNVVAYDDMLCWVDLTRGLLVRNPLDPNPHLSFVALLDLTGVALQDRHEGLQGIDSFPIVRVSGGRLRFVDVARRHGEPPGATRVVVWTLESLFDPSIGRARWDHHQCTTTLAAI